MKTLFLILFATMGHSSALGDSTVYSYCYSHRSEVNDGNEIQTRREFKLFGPRRGQSQSRDFFLEYNMINYYRSEDKAVAWESKLLTEDHFAFMRVNHGSPENPEWHLEITFDGYLDRYRIRSVSVRAGFWRPPSHLRVAEASLQIEDIETGGVIATEENFSCVGEWDLNLGFVFPNFQWSEKLLSILSQISERVEPWRSDSLF